MFQSNVVGDLAPAGVSERHRAWKRQIFWKHNGGLHLGSHCKVEFKRSVRIILVTNFATLQGGAMEVGKELSLPVV